VPWPALIAAVFVTACGGGGGPPAQGPGAEPPRAAPLSCAVADQRDWLRSYVQDDYLWTDGRRAPDDNAATIDAYFRSMLDTPRDRYSYTEPAAAADQFYKDGTRTGYGYTVVWTDAARTQLRVRFVEPFSPVAQAGLRRGDMVLAIDGLDAQAVAQGRLPTVTTPGVPRRFTVVGADGVRRDVVAVSQTFALGTVSHDRVIDAGGPAGPVKVAYMAYHEFIIPSETVLDRVFREFIAAGARELVLDLRYNGGGNVFMARGLASMVGGSRVNGQTFADFRYNARNAARNWLLPMTTNLGLLPGPPLEGLQRVFIITSPDTASASELLINALRPFMPVIVVGDTTFGKPYGFQPRTECGTSFNLVTLESFNARGEGGFTAGIAPQCPVPDDLDRELGDPLEARLAAALHYVRFGACPTPVRQPMASAKAAGARQPGGTPGGAPGDVYGEVAPRGLRID